MQYVRLSVNEEKQPLLQVRNLKKYFPIIKGFFNRVTGHIQKHNVGRKNLNSAKLKSDTLFGVILLNP